MLTREVVIEVDIRLVLEVHFEPGNATPIVG